MENRGQSFSGVLLHRRQGMGVDRERDLALLVAQAPLDNVGVHAGLDVARLPRDMEAAVVHAAHLSCRFAIRGSDSKAEPSPLSQIGSRVGTLHSFSS